MKDFSIKAFMSDDSGATAIEYAMIAGGIALVIIASVSTLGESSAAMFDRVVAAFG